MIPFRKGGALYVAMKLPKRLKITFRDVSRKVRVDEFEIGNGGIRGIGLEAPPSSEFEMDMHFIVLLWLFRIEGVLKWVSEEFHLKIDTFHLVS
eukprot:1351392-Amorphochlora_amoeboformis.AAC.1